MTRLTDDEVRAALDDDLPGWSYDGAAISKEFAFRGFKSAITFIVRLADEAERAGHHPDLENHYNLVRVSLNTWDEGGVTAKDLALARAIESVAEPPEA